MSFNRRILPSREKMEEMRKNFSSDQEFVNHIRGKADSLEGSSESFRYLEELEKKIKSDR
jgi:hypothetical protein